MQLVVPAGQDMATKADVDAAVVAISARINGLEVRMDGLEPKEYVLRMLLIT